MASPSEAWFRRQRIWAHNALHGQAAMTHGCMISIINSPTATDEAKQIASSIQTLAHQLKLALKERKE